MPSLKSRPHPTCLRHSFGEEVSCFPEVGRRSCLRHHRMNPTFGCAAPEATARIFTFTSSGVIGKALCALLMQEGMGRIRRKMRTIARDATPVFSHRSILSEYHVVVFEPSLLWLLSCLLSADPCHTSRRRSLTLTLAPPKH